MEQHSSSSPHPTVDSDSDMDNTQGTSSEHEQQDQNQHPTLQSTQRQQRSQLAEKSSAHQKKLSRSLPATYKIQLHLRKGEPLERRRLTHGLPDPEPFDYVLGQDTFATLRKQIATRVSRHRLLTWPENSAPYIKPAESVPQKYYQQLTPENYEENMAKAWKMEAKRLPDQGLVVLNLFVYLKENEQKEAGQLGRPRGPKSGEDQTAAPRLSDSATIAHQRLSGTQRAIRPPESHLHNPLSLGRSPGDLLRRPVGRPPRGPSDNPVRRPVGRPPSKPVGNPIRRPVGRPPGVPNRRVNGNSIEHAVVTTINSSFNSDPSPTPLSSSTGAESSTTFSSGRHRLSAIPDIEPSSQGSTPTATAAQDRNVMDLDDLEQQDGVDDSLTDMTSSTPVRYSRSSKHQLQTGAVENANDGEFKTINFKINGVVVPMLVDIQSLRAALSS